MRIALIVVLSLFGCTSNNADTELMCEVKCKKCEDLMVTCKGDKVIKIIEVEN